MSLTNKQIYDLNNMNVAAQNVQLGTLLNGVASTDSPELSGTPTAPTATAGTNTTQIATTAFVQTAVAGCGNSNVIDYDDSTMTAADVAEAIEAVLNAGLVPVIKWLGEIYTPWRLYTEGDETQYNFTSMSATLDSSTITLATMSAINVATVDGKVTWSLDTGYVNLTIS